MLWPGTGILPWGPVFLLTLKPTHLMEIILAQRRVSKMLTVGAKAASSRALQLCLQGLAG